MGHVSTYKSSRWSCTGEWMVGDDHASNRACGEIKEYITPGQPSNGKSKETCTCPHTCTHTPKKAEAAASIICLNVTRGWQQILGAPSASPYNVAAAVGLPPSASRYFLFFSFAKDPYYFLLLSSSLIAFMLSTYTCCLYSMRYQIHFTFLRNRERYTPYQCVKTQ